MQNGQANDAVTGKLRQWLCSDLNGRIFVHSGNPEILPESIILGFGDTVVTATVPFQWSGQTIVNYATTGTTLTFAPGVLDGQFNLIVAAPTAGPVVVNGNFDQNPSGTFTLTAGESALVTFNNFTYHASIFGGGGSGSGCTPDTPLTILGANSDASGCVGIPNSSYDPTTGDMTLGQGDPSFESLFVTSNHGDSFFDNCTLDDPESCLGFSAVVGGEGGVFIDDQGPQPLIIQADGPAQIEINGNTGGISVTDDGGISVIEESAADPIVLETLNGGGQGFFNFGGTVGFVFQDSSTAGFSFDAGYNDGDNTGSGLISFNSLGGYSFTDNSTQGIGFLESGNSDIGFASAAAQEGAVTIAASDAAGSIFFNWFSGQSTFDFGSNLDIAMFGSSTITTNSGQIMADSSDIGSGLGIVENGAAGLGIANNGAGNLQILSSSTGNVIFDATGTGDGTGPGTGEVQSLSAGGIIFSDNSTTGILGVEMNTSGFVAFGVVGAGSFGANDSGANLGIGSFHFDVGQTTPGVGTMAGGPLDSLVGYRANGVDGITEACTVAPTAINFTYGIVTSITGGSCTP